MLQPKVKPKIGLLPTGHKIYWGQFPSLKKMGEAMYNRLIKNLEEFGDVLASDLVDTYEKALEAAFFFTQNEIDVLLVFPFGYTTGMMIVPAVRAVNVPIRLLNAHEDATYDYRSADTVVYLHHEGPCCIPEYAGTLISLGKNFEVISGHFDLPEFWEEIKRTSYGAAAATAFTKLRFAIIGNTYTNMTDMPTDEHRVLAATGQLICRPEVEEIEEAYKNVTREQRQDMYAQFRSFYEIDETVTDDHMEESAKIAVAFDMVINKYKIDGFGFYWWGKKEYMTELRAQAALAVSRLTALGIPGVTEGDVKAAMAMKILDLLGGGGMFLEFFSADYNGNFILMGHDGPSNVNIAANKPKLVHLKVHHGKTGEGLGIDFNMKPNVCTLLNLTQFGTKKTFKLIYTVGEIVGGDILNIGNPNCRIRVKKPIPEFFNNWCKQGPEHHTALGLEDFSKELEVFAEKMNFECIRI
jgi:L-arabinose isomerase